MSDILIDWKGLTPSRSLLNHSFIGNAVSRQLGNVPVPFLIRHAAFLYQNQLQDLHRLGEQQDFTAQLHGTSRPMHFGVIGPGTVKASLGGSLVTHQQPSPLSQWAQGVKEGLSTEPLVNAGYGQLSEKDQRSVAKREGGTFSGIPNNNSNPSINQICEGASKAQASPSLSGSISTFPSSARPASMSSSASTIRPVQPSSPSSSLRNAAVDNNVYSSGVLSNRGPSQPRSTRGSQLINAQERRLNNPMTMLPTSPRDENAMAESIRRVAEPAHPFHQATLSASTRLSHPSTSSGHSARSSPGRSATQGNPSIFQDQERSSTVSSVSTPYSQSNSTSQIFEETSFFNQLSSNDSFSRGQQLGENTSSDRHGAFQQSSFTQMQGVYGLGFMDQTPFYSQTNHHHHNDDDDDETEDEHTDREGDSASQDESGPLSEQIKQLHLEDVLAFLPSTGASTSGILQKPTNDGYQRRTASGDKMPFQLDDELASLGTGALEEILDHGGGDDDDDHRVRGIRFKETVGPIRMRSLGHGEFSSKIRTSPERSGASSRKSSAQNSVGSSFSDLSDSSVTQSAMEDAYLSGYNNSKISLFMHASTRN
ncbi:hypothetical protein BC939DRAFT_71520 [Gamsiella multidivaricata]|uniref:uncharacterized protein n=1 Tax=Gamsiella multidivaricata TaxID=101098 RepID=UPI002220B1B5|nr:uncharacterized protein BC939DRAFT_71520 [Gamsiella multidivaricata]KAI7828233.1 hypothetical protein BC939DRAFT_71520 [Gamsiella multidivaricata]